jgi:hypothetical protein
LFSGLAPLYEVEGLGVVRLVLSVMIRIFRVRPPSILYGMC